ncbi:MAG: M42 family metallopeptidase [Chloroflexi bacterium]|nr:M42 family metallopeptidase [Chloroflexota bacterium]
MTVLSNGFLKALTEIPGGPGDEGAVRDLIARTLYPHVQDLSVDTMGNLVVVKRGHGNSGPKLVVSAHMDEVVLFVTDIDEAGFLHVATSGVVNPRTMLGKAVRVGPERLPGVICHGPVHHIKASQRGTMPAVEDLVVDIGAQDGQTAKAKVKIGHRLIFQTPFRLMGTDQTIAEDAPLPKQGRMSGKAFDNRLGCAILTELLVGDPLDFDLIGVFTVQEELGLRGALAASHHVQADVVIVLEGTVCDDLPGPSGEQRYPTTRLGDGPALTQRDRRYIVHPQLLQYLLRIASDHDIPYQFKQPNIGGTDAAGFAHFRGIPVGIISVPCRYIHGPTAVADLSDFHHVLALLRAALPGLVNVPGVRHQH